MPKPFTNITSYMAGIGGIQGPEGPPGPANREMTYQIISGIGDVEDTGFTSIGAVSIDAIGRSSIVKAVFNVVVETTNVLDSVQVRLFNITTATVLTSSILQSASLIPASLSSSIKDDILIGQNCIYELQMRLMTTGTPNLATCKGAKIIIEWG